MRESDLIPGTVRVRKVRGHLVGAANAGGQVYVFSGRCPHAGRSLDGGDVSSGGIVTCPGHGYRYWLRPGTAAPIRQFPFRVRDGVIEVDWQALRRGLRSMAD